MGSEMCIRDSFRVARGADASSIDPGRWDEPHQGVDSDPVDRDLPPLVASPTLEPVVAWMSATGERNPCFLAIESLPSSTRDCRAISLATEANAASTCRFSAPKAAFTAMSSPGVSAAAGRSATRVSRIEPALFAGERLDAVSYTHLTLPTIYSV